MATKLLLGKDQNGAVVYSLPFPLDGVDTTLSANTEQHTTVPANVDIAFFSYSSGSNVFVDIYGTSDLPGGSFAATTTELNPVVRGVTPGQILSFISDTISYIKVSYYNMNGLSAT